MKERGKEDRMKNRKEKELGVFKNKRNVGTEPSAILYIGMLVGEQAKRARHPQVCSIENRGYIYYHYIYIISTCNFVLITRKEGGA